MFVHLKINLISPNYYFLLIFILFLPVSPKKYYRESPSLILLNATTWIHFWLDLIDFSLSEEITVRKKEHYMNFDDFSEVLRFIWYLIISAKTVKNNWICHFHKKPWTTSPWLSSFVIFFSDFLFSFYDLWVLDFSTDFMWFVATLICTENS